MGDIVLIFIILSILLRGKLFKDRDTRYRWTFVPFYNKIILGKLSESKKLGIVTAISSFIFTTLLSVCLYIEYSILCMLPKEITDINTFNIEDYIPQSYITTNDLLKIMLIVAAGIYFIAWVALMYRFSEKQGASTWWMILWGIIPAIPYCYFTYVYKNIYIPSEGLVKMHKIKIPTEVKKGKIKNKK